MLFDIHKLCWDEELMEIMGGIPESILPEVRPSSDPDVYGYTDETITGCSIPVCGDLGDQQASLLGQGCLRPGEIKNTYGTGNFILMNTGDVVKTSKHGLLSTIAYKIGDGPMTYALEGSVFVTGAAVQWLRDGLKIIGSADETEALATSVGDNNGVYFVPSFVGLGAPHWNMYARGTIVGLTMGATKAHIVRAALESECFRTRDVIDAMKADSGFEVKHLRADGGGSRNRFMMQFQADILDVPVVTSHMSETTSLGAAFAAGLAVGFWTDQKELANMCGSGKVFKPTMSHRKREMLYKNWCSAEKCAIEWGNRSYARTES